MNFQIEKIWAAELGDKTGGLEEEIFSSISYDVKYFPKPKPKVNQIQSLGLCADLLPQTNNSRQLKVLG